MTNEQFKVTFTANNQLSAELTKITHDLDATYQMAGKTTQGVAALSKAFAPTASMTKFTNSIGKAQAALQNLTTSGLNVTKLNQISSAANNLGNSLTKISQVQMPKDLYTTLRKLSSLSVTPLVNSMKKLAVATGNVERNLKNIVKSLTAMQSMGALNAKISVHQGGTGGTGGTTPQQQTGVQGFAASSNWRDFEKTLHIFNSLTYAVGTVKLAFQALYDTIARGNELTRAQSLLMGISQTKGMLLGTNATERYSAAIRVATKNQLLFGGSFAESINGILKLQQIAISAGVSVEQLNNVVQLLAMRDPIQGIEGATIAVQELMSGDPMSLRRRFELPSDEVNALANAAGDAKGQIAGLTALLGTQGITAEVLASQLDTTAAAYARFGAVTSFASETFGQDLAEIFKKPTEELTNFVAQSLYGYGSMNTSVGQFGNTISNLYMGPMASLLGQIPLIVYETSEMKYAFREANQEIFDGWIQMGMIHDPYRMKELEALSYGVGHYDAIANEMINTQMRANDTFMQTGLITAGLGDTIGDFINQKNQENQVLRRDLILKAALIDAENDYGGAVKVTAQALGISEAEASRLIKTQQTNVKLTEEHADYVKILADAYDIEWPVEELNETAKATQAVADETQRLTEEITNLTKSFAKEKEQTLINTHLQYALAYVMSGTASSATLLDNAALMLVEALGLSGEAARIAYGEFKKLLQLQLDNANLTDKQFEDYWNLSLAQTEVAKTTAKVADETERLNEIYQDTMERLVDFDKEVYRKRIREMQSYYAEATLLQQQRAYEMLANDLDLVEGRNSKLEAADRQRLLARENIEAYGQLQINEAVAKANEIALGGNAKFAQEYLKIQEDRINEVSQLYQQLHDTQVRLEGDPEAQQRAKQIYDESIALMDEYYNTKVGLANAAAREQQEEETSQRRQIIDDAIEGALQLQNIDETQRQAIIQGLEITKTAITDLSNTYVSKVDAMRGSINSLIEALARLRKESTILTSGQLDLFNKSGIGQISTSRSGNVPVDSSNTSTVNVGGINISVQSPITAEEVKKIVMSTLQSQLNQRG